MYIFFFSSRRRHTICALVTGVQTCALPIFQALLGKEAQFELEWVSIYTFACERMDRFRHGRIVFVGDSAHRVSPFGARGAHSGVQDTDNLGWQLAPVRRDLAPETILDIHATEREQAANAIL